MNEGQRTGRDSEDEWDFYPCRVDDAPASIFLNLRYERSTPSSIATLYWVRVYMLQPGEHRMGTAAEAEALHPAEDQLVERLVDLGFIYVGRLRNHGCWQLTFYGPRDKNAELGTAAAEMKLGGRDFDVGSKPDDGWSYYRDFLFPSSERRQWMRDRRLVQVLEEHGDTLVAPRRVDHWAYFSTADARKRFIVEATRDGFAQAATNEDSASTRPFGVQIFRTDSVALEHIHDVVMKLCDTTKQHDGEYDGWETSVETPASG